MVKNFYSVLIATLATLLLAYCQKPTDPAISHSPALYTLTYNGNGAASGTMPIDSTEYRKGDTITVKGNTANLAQGSRDFAGWTTEQTATEPLFEEGSTFEISRSLTLYAVWKGKPYTINFDANHDDAGGSQASLADQIWEGPITLPTTTTISPPPGMGFAGWSETRTGAVIRGTYRGPAIYSATLSLYAVWGGSPYTINFDANQDDAGGSQASLTNQFRGARITLPATTTFTSPPDMSFVGWSESSTGAVIQGTYSGPTNYSATVTLYAVWGGRSHTINFDKNHTEARGTQESLTNQFRGARITLPGTTFIPPPDKRFAGWAESSTGTVIQWTYSGPATHSPTVTLYAVWKDLIFGSRKWQAIAMSSDDGSKLVAAEYKSYLYTSTDSGGNWTDRSSTTIANNKIAGNKRWQAIAMSSDGVKLAVVEYRGHLYTSTDSGATSGQIAAAPTSQ